MRKKLESPIKAAVWCAAAVSLAGAIWLMFTRNPDAVVFNGAGFGLQLLGAAAVILMLAYFLIQSLLAWSYREAPELSDEELPKCTVIVDEAAAKELQGKDYYHWIFANEPEWRQYQDCLKD